MAQGGGSWSWLFRLVGALAVSGTVINFSGTCALSQIKPDATLGAESSSVRGNVQIKGLESDRIEGGARRGSNLFHSFQEFNIDEGRGAYFTNLVGIKNIFSRVTGNDRSDILGTLGVSGRNANLFLINPKGIIFGPNARLDVSGSFVGTTANGVGLVNGDSFSTNPGDPLPTGLLNVNPNVFLFNQLAVQPIIINSRRSLGVGEPLFFPPYEELEGIKVPNGQSLLLVGGDVSLDGGILKAPGGRVELGGIAATGTVGLSVDNNIWRLSFPDGIARAIVSITNQALVNVAAGGSGDLAINARKLDILGGSTLSAGIEQELGTVDAQAGDITINVTGAITVGQSSPIFSSRVENRVNFNATGNSGNINVRAKSLSMTDGARISTNNFGLGGNAGSISVQTEDGVSLSKNSYMDSSTTGSVPKVGDSGAIQIEARSLFMEEGAWLSVSNSRSVSLEDDINFGQGNAGSISLQVEDAISIRDSLIDSILGSLVIGNGGSIEIKARSLTMTDEGRLSTSLNGKGEGGNISVQVEDAVSLTTSTITSAVGFADLDLRGEGNGGNIQIQAGSLVMPADAYISAGTSGWGDGGNISVQVEDMVSLASSSAISSSINPRGEGNGGNIRIQAGSLFLTNQARLNTDAGGLEGNAGSISVQVEDEVSLSNSSIDSNVNLMAKGNGGNIRVEAESLFLANGAKLNSSTKGQGYAGDIKINTSDFVSISGANPALLLFSGLFATTEEYATGQGGNIEIVTGALRVSDRARLDAQTKNAFRSGNITVNTNTFEATDGGQILTTAFSTGDAGNITINATDSVTLSGSDPSVPNRFAQLGPETVDLDGSASGLFTLTNGDGNPDTIDGDAGDLTINTGQLTVRNGAQASASTFGTGDGGTLNVAADVVEVSGTSMQTPSSLTAQTNGDGNPDTMDGDAGDLTIDTGQLTIRDRAGVTVSSEGVGNAGNLEIMSRLIDLNNQAVIKAETASGNGGNITLGAPDSPLDLLLMRNASQISTTAGTTRQGGDGGNIIIDAPNGFIVAVPDENSDITANAFSGSGGSVRTNAADLFGLAPLSRQDLERLRPNDLDPRQLQTNDITAISQQNPSLSGTVELNTPDVDPSQGIIALPEEVVDVSGLITQTCPAGSGPRQSKFVVTGRGGVPPNPGETLNTDAVQVDLVTLNPNLGNHSSPDAQTTLNSSSSAFMVEAQGWVKDAKGNVVLTANAPAVNPHGSWQKTAKC